MSGSRPVARRSLEEQIRSTVAFCLVGAAVPQETPWLKVTPSFAGLAG
jgi:hypothetical protein